MGIRFRKSYKVGPLRINVSKSGIGWSIGGKGARFTKKANGGYRTTLSVPGSGIQYVKDFSSPKSQAVLKSDSHYNDMSPEEPSNKSMPQKHMKRFNWRFVLAFAVMLIIFNMGYFAWENLGSYLNILARDAVYTKELSPDAVWDNQSPIQFVAYPGQVYPGDMIGLEIKASPECTYNILVMTDQGQLDCVSLIPSVANVFGHASWVWQVPVDAKPGIYCIEVCDRSGVKNCIDYVILDSMGNVVGDPPSRVKTEKPELVDTFLEIDLLLVEDDALHDLVYVTENGGKYHNSFCQHLKNSKTTISRSAAVAAGYSACTHCNP